MIYKFHSIKQCIKVAPYKLILNTVSFNADNMINFQNGQVINKYGRRHKKLVWLKLASIKNRVQISQNLIDLYYQYHLNIGKYYNTFIRDSLLFQKFYKLSKMIIQEFLSHTNECH